MRFVDVQDLLVLDITSRSNVLLHLSYYLTETKKVT